jgi:hypothetical protein
MSIEMWTALGIISGAILAVIEVFRRVVRPMWRYLRRTLRNVNAQHELFVGDAVKGIPSVPARLSDVERRLVELRDAMDRHVQWHADPGGTPAAAAQNPPRPNGSRRRRPNNQ